MSGLKTAFAPDTVKDGLNEVFFSKFNEKPAPAMVVPGDDKVWRQRTMDNGGETTVISNDGGMFVERQEEQDADVSNVIVTDKVTYTPVEYSKSLPIPQVYFEDKQYNVIAEKVAAMGRKARLTMLRESMAIYRNAFTTATTNNGTALISDSQSNLNGDTIDNLISGALSNTTLEDAVNTLFEMKDQSGDNVGFEPHCLLVPNRLFSTACELVESEFTPEDANNSINVYSSKYDIYVKQSNFLGAANGGSNTAWYLLARDHSVTRNVRLGVQIEFRPWKYSNNFVNYYLARFREVVYALTYEGIVGSTGA